MKVFYRLRRAVRKARKQSIPLLTVRVDEEPEPLQPSTLYLLGNSRKPWAAIILCPCGCKEIVRLNLLVEARPCWTATNHFDCTTSLNPSIFRTTGCKSHFWIRHGVVEWAGHNMKAQLPSMQNGKVS